MAGVLLSGPAGAGKSQRARQLIEDATTPVVVADFQSLYASLLQIDRRPDGRYPERLESQAYVIPLVEYLRQTLMRVAAESQIDVIATNSDGSPVRRKALLDAIGPGAVETSLTPA